MVTARGEPSVTDIPFKATRKVPDERLNPDGRQLRRFERQGTSTIFQALQDYFEATWGMVSQFNIHQAAANSQSEAVLRPFRDALTAWLQTVSTAGAEFGQGQIERYVLGVKALVKQTDIDIDWTLPNNDAAEWAIQYGRELTGQLAKTTNERIQREIANFIRNSETLDQLIERVQGGYLYSYDRAQAIAVTETTRAYAEGNKAAWKAGGIIQKMEWRTANDEIVCPICFPLNGQRTELDGQFPGGLSSPPGHVRCRCWIVPVTEFLDGG
jgi:SPP1 gp7 family putative phage head morphogenesis protein